MRAKRFPKYTMLKIWWDDIVSDSGWHTHDEIENAKAEPVISMGFYLGNKKGCIKIAHDIADDAGSDYQVIPFGCITKIIELKETE